VNAFSIVFASVKRQKVAPPNYALQQPSAAILISRGSLSLSAAAAAEFGRSAGHAKTGG
jgi:hypothetical protein